LKRRAFIRFHPAQFAMESREAFASSA
jgi:hypothetical protein